MKYFVTFTGKLAVSLAALLLAACSDLFMDEEKTLQLARDYLATGDVIAGAIELRNTLSDNPDNAEARYRLATIYLDFGDFPTAEKEFKRAQASGWDDAESQAGQVRAQLGMGDFEAVLKNSQPHDAWPAALRAEILATRALANAALGNSDEAFTDLEAAQAVDADAAAVLRTGVQLRIVEGGLDDAATALRRALTLYPEDQELLLIQARLLSATDPDAAEKACRQVIALDPGDFISVNGRSARRFLVQLQILDGRFDEAEAVLRPLFGRDSRDPFTNYLGGVIAFRQGDYGKASEMLLKVLKLAPDHNPTRLLFGTVNYAQKNYEQAAYFLSKYVATVPDNLVARKLLARSYILLGRNAEAADILQSAGVDDADDPELLALVGMSELNMGRTASGIAGLEQAVRVNPGSMELRSELARAYIEAGETGLAIKELQGLLADGGEQSQTETLLILAHLRAGDNGKAIDRVLEAVSHSPDDPAMQALAGVVFAASEDLAEARKYFSRALELQPGFQPATMSLAHVEEQDGNLELAKQLYTELVDTGSESVLPMLALARVAEQQGDRAVLLGWLERALEHAPADMKPRIFLAEYHLREGELAAAETYAREGLEIAPKEPALLAVSGRIYLAGGKYRKALRPLETLVKLQPQSARVRILLAEAHLQLDEFDSARRELQVARKNSPKDASVLSTLARLELKSGDYDRALAYSREIRDTWPELFLGFELSGDSKMASGRFDDAETEYSQAWDRMQSSSLLVKRAENATRAGRAGQAIEWLQAWFDEHPDDAGVAQFLGTSLQNAGRTADAMTVYRKVIDLDPGNAVALNNLAGLYLAAEQPGALDLAKRAWLVDENNPGIQDTYGWALVTAGQIGRGLELLKQALKGLPDIPEVRYHYAVGLYKAGDKQEARELLEALLEEYDSFDGRDAAEQLLAGQGSKG